MMYLQVIGGFVLLLGGAEALVRGAVALAKRLGISPLVIGMTVIALGTSAPEFMVSLEAALNGAPGMALGNVIGSNIANILLILGAAALVKPILVQPAGLLKDGLMLLGGSVLFMGLALPGTVGFWSGIVLLTVFVLFLAYSYRREKKDSSAAKIHLHEAEEFEDLPRTWTLTWISLLAGLGAILFGADILVKGGVTIARDYGVSEEVIGLTLIAFGTSLPELAASVVAAWRGHSDVALGNVVGSNLFNMLLIIGAVATVTPLSVPEQLMNFDLWVMIAITVMLIPFMAGWLRFNRIEASVFLVLYGTYIWVQAFGVSEILAKIG